MNGRKILEYSVLVGATFLLSQTAFGTRERREIKKRSQGFSEVSGLRCMPMECSHILHGLPEAKYGMYMTVLEHYLYHEAFRERPELINLSRRDNDSAIASVRQRVQAFYDKKNWDYPDAGYLERVTQRTLFAVSEYCDEIGIDNPVATLLADMEA